MSLEDEKDRKSTSSFGSATNRSVEFIATGDEEIDKFLKECLDTMRSKGHDYTQGNSDRLHNFRTVGAALGIKMEQTWAVYFYKHYAALMSFIKNGGQTESEPIEGRIKDMIVYLLLCKKIVTEMKQEKTKKTATTIQVPKIIL